tara:strand:+ start:4253 stop:4432 length:180 start_codon:yes stop_codon:yes gene_type:complete
MQKKKGRPKKTEVNYLKGKTKTEKEVLKKPIKNLKDIPQEFKTKKRIGFWAWLFPKIWK